MTNAVVGKSECRAAFEKWIKTQQMPCDIPMAFAAWQAAWNARQLDLANPDMPDQQLRLYFGELTAQGVRDVRAAIRFANNYILHGKP